MIVARICNEKGKPLVGSGSCHIARYDGKDDGWFPVDSFDFGFNPKQDESNEPGAQRPAQATGAKQGPPAHPQAPGGGKKGDKKDFAELQISKQLDTATLSLMLLAMQERKAKKGVGEKSTVLHADIHTISSMSFAKQDRFHYTSLMIHLEAVNVQSWKINGSGDSRPTENVSLRYDRAAMIYVSTGQGKDFLVVGPKGYDQTANEPWTWNDSEMRRYYPAADGLLTFIR